MDGQPAPAPLGHDKLIQLLSDSIRGNAKNTEGNAKTLAATDKTVTGGNAKNIGGLTLIVQRHDNDIAELETARKQQQKQNDDLEGKLRKMQEDIDMCRAGFMLGALLGALISILVASALPC